MAGEVTVTILPYTATASVTLTAQELTLKGLTGETSVAVSAIVIEGPPGPEGVWGVDRAFELRQLSLPIDAGKVVIDCDDANTVFVYLDEDVTEIEFTNLPPAGVSLRMQLYFQQDGVGARNVAGWPSSVYPADDIPPPISPVPNMRSSLVIDTFDGGVSWQLCLVAYHGPIIGYTP